MSALEGIAEVAGVPRIAKVTSGLRPWPPNIDGNAPSAAQIRLAKKVAFVYQSPIHLLRANMLAHAFMPPFDLMKAVSG